MAPLLAQQGVAQLVPSGVGLALLCFLFLSALQYSKGPAHPPRLSPSTFHLPPSTFHPPPPTPHPRLWMAAITAVLTFSCGIALAYAYPSNVGDASPAVFAAVVGLSQLVSSVFAGFIGCSLPMYFSRDGIDPANCTGPGETAFQDSVGTLLLVFLSSALLVGGAHAQ